jgi:hypothetical protein
MKILLNLLTALLALMSLTSGADPLGSVGFTGDQSPFTFVCDGNVVDKAVVFRGQPVNQADIIEFTLGGEPVVGCLTRLEIQEGCIILQPLLENRVPANPSDANIGRGLKGNWENTSGVWLLRLCPATIFSSSFE